MTNRSIALAGLVVIAVIAILCATYVQATGATEDLGLVAVASAAVGAVGGWIAGRDEDGV